jgi:hypothetical protein
VPAASSDATDAVAKITTWLILRMLVLCCAIGLVFAGTDATSRLSKCYTVAASAVFAAARISYSFGRSVLHLAALMRHTGAHASVGAVSTMGFNPKEISNTCSYLP